MQLGSRVAVAVVQASGYSSDSTPSLGTSMCPGCGPKKTIDQKKKEIHLSFSKILYLLESISEFSIFKN